MRNEQMLEYIRHYYIESDVVVPRRASVSGLNLRVLSKRLHDARNAFLVLIDNNMFVDACLIAGHILEVSATIHYIRSAADKMLNSRIGSRIFTTWVRLCNFGLFFIRQNIGYFYVLYV